MANDLKSTTLVSAVLTTGAGTAYENTRRNKTFHGYGTTGTGAGAATIKIQVSNVAIPGTNDWIDAGTIVLTLSTTNADDGFAMSANWRWVRGNVSAISGTTATVSLIMIEGE